MNLSLLLPVSGILIGGVFLSSQAPINAALARALGDPLLAACISFGIGFLILAIISAFRGALPSGSAIASAPWWSWLGGFLGAFGLPVQEISWQRVVAALLILGGLVLSRAG